MPVEIKNKWVVWSWYQVPVAAFSGATGFRPLLPTQRLGRTSTRRWRYSFCQQQQPELLEGNRVLSIEVPPFPRHEYSSNPSNSLQPMGVLGCPLFNEMWPVNVDYRLWKPWDPRQVLSTSQAQQERTTNTVQYLVEEDVPDTIAPWRVDRGRCWEGRCPCSCCGDGSSDSAHFPGWTSSGNLRSWGSSAVKSPSCVFSFRAAAGTRRPRRFQKQTIQHTCSLYLSIKVQNINDTFWVCNQKQGFLCWTTTALWVRYISFEVKRHTSTTISCSSRKPEICMLTKK